MQDVGRTLAGGRAPFAAATVLTCGVLTGCESPVPFYPPGRDPDGPVVGLGGPAPYLRRAARRRARARRPVPRRSRRPRRRGADGARGRARLRRRRSRMISPDARGVPPRLYVAHGRAVEIVDAAPPGRRAAANRGRPGRGVVGHAAPLGHDPAGGASSRSGRAARADARCAPGRQPGCTSRRRAERAGPGAPPAPRRVRDRRTMRRGGSVPLPCAARYADFTSDGASLVATCTSAGALARVDVAGRRSPGRSGSRRGASPATCGCRRTGRCSRGRLRQAASGWWTRPASPCWGSSAPARGRAACRSGGTRAACSSSGLLTAVEFATRRVSAVAAPRPPSPCRAACRRTGRPVARRSRRPRLRGLHPDGPDPAEVPRLRRPSGLSVHPQPGRHSLGGTGLYR